VRQGELILLAAFRTAPQDPIDVLRSKELDRRNGFGDQTEKRISVFLIVLKRRIDCEHLRRLRIPLAA